MTSLATPLPSWAVGFTPGVATPLAALQATLGYEALGLAGVGLVPDPAFHQPDHSVQGAASLGVHESGPDPRLDRDLALL